MEKLTYEVAITKLEEIVKQLEQGDATLEESINLFTEGISLIKICNQHLDQAEGKIKVLLDDKLEDFNLTKES